jgi:hypothetical protein
LGKNGWPGNINTQENNPGYLFLTEQLENIVRTVSNMKIGWKETEYPTTKSWNDQLIT